MPSPHISGTFSENKIQLNKFVIIGATYLEVAFSRSLLTTSKADALPALIFLMTFSISDTVNTLSRISHFDDIFWSKCWSSDLTACTWTLSAIADGSCLFSVVKWLTQESALTADDVSLTFGH